MNTGSDKEPLLSGDALRKERIRSSSDEELVERVFDKTIGSEQEAVTAQAELTRHQMVAIKEFNTSSTRLAWIMIGLTVAIGAIAVLQLVTAFKK